MARPVRPIRIRDERARAQAAEDRIWDETSAAYAAEQSAPADDTLKPLATRGPDVTFTDDELKDF